MASVGAATTPAPTGHTDAGLGAIPAAVALKITASLPGPAESWRRLRRPPPPSPRMGNVCLDPRVVLWVYLTCTLWVYSSAGRAVDADAALFLYELLPFQYFAGLARRSTGGTLPNSLDALEQAAFGWL